MVDFWRRHRRVRSLSVGLMTEVLLATAEPERCGRMLAVKRLLRSCAGEPLVESLFAEEASLAARLSHANIVSTLDVCLDRDGTLCLVMEHVDGPTLAELVRMGRLPAAVAIHIAREALAGLGHMHQARIRGRRGLVHGEFAPENVLLSSDGRVKIADFGATRAVSGQDVSPRVLKTAMASYVSPEELNGQSVDSRSDLFSVGAVLWELLAGVPLFAGMTPGEVAAEVDLHPLRLPGAVRPGVPHDMEDVVMRLLAREPRARYQAAAEAIDDLARYADAPRNGAGELARLIADRTAPRSTEERGRREPWHAVPAFHARPLLLLDVPRREPRDYNPDEHLTLLDALHGSAPWNRSRDMALAHVLYRCGLTIATAVALDIGQLHLGRRAFLGVTLAGSSEPRDVPFDDVVCDALERYVSERRSRIRSDGSNALFLWDQGARLPAEVAHAVMRAGRSG
jgi:serine/threonine protein kinase